MGDVRENFLKPLARQFTLPKGATDDPAAWESDYLRSLSSFDDETLKGAAQALMDIRLTRTFPLVGECNKACRDTIEAEAIRQMESGKEHARKEHDPLEIKHPECSQRRIDAAHRMMKDYPLIKEAADEFWIWGLFDFCCKNRSTPDKYQVETIKRKSKVVIRDLVNAVGDGTRIENASMMRGNLLGMWIVAHNRHRDAVDLPRITSEELSALFSGYRQSEAA